ncbi:hypothetical protein [Rhizobium leguminosarum]|uniref:Nucleotide modification associated domain-containing protein n=1 Tax=Rhizobium leguminosarum TaxID=384 RepID=A0A7M3DWP1_RHILE|nr:hypothetical protein [Rhizobium leguminosarum]NKK45795.1 hypothetical protein [Rhizobium leguminosarum bv. viciae]TAY53105.1 hypothetical protein ELH90_16480 [Rhizobium leguminosarum]
MEVQQPEIRRSHTTANTLYRYVIDHDMGFSPNPFHGCCTLANCKPVIRRCAKIGDFVLGFGSAKSNIRGKLIYWLQVEEILTYDEYWADARFFIKRSVVNGSHIKFHGDNIYHRDLHGNFIQEPSFHSLPDGSTNYINLNTDTGSTDRMLISKTFGYYGKDAISVPEGLVDIVAIGRGHRTFLNGEVKSRAIEWLLNDTSRGFLGEPSGWSEIKA